MTTMDHLYDANVRCPACGKTVRVPASAADDNPTIILACAEQTRDRLRAERSLEEASTAPKPGIESAGSGVGSDGEL